MLYLVGGTARAGKTTVARRFVKDTWIPYFSLDYLMMGIARGVPELQVDPNEGDLITARKLLQIIDPMVTAMLENKADYILEGVQLIPEHVKELQVKFPDQVHACFIGFATADIGKKCEELTRYGCLSENDWSKDYTKAELESEVKKLIAHSIIIRDECMKHGITYFDVNSDFNGTIETVANYLKMGI